jgi:hypothetical protein
VWNRVADAASVTASQNSSQTPPSSTFRTTEATASSPESLRADFEALNKKADALFIETMRSYNRQDKSSLEALKKRIGSSEVGFLQKIQEALDAVANNESFVVSGLAELKKRTAIERSLVDIKITRDRNYISAWKSVFTKSRAGYEALFKRATAANDLTLAKEIQEQMVALTQGSFSIVGIWREGQWSRLRVTINSDGTVLHEDHHRGIWEQISPGVFRITKGDGGFFGGIWEFSPGGKMLDNRGAKLIRE